MYPNLKASEKYNVSFKTYYDNKKRCDSPDIIVEELKPQDQGAIALLLCVIPPSEENTLLLLVNPY